MTLRGLALVLHPVEHMLSCTKPYEPTAVLRQAREMTTPLG
jgi:hypothetical protein